MGFKDKRSRFGDSNKGEGRMGRFDKFRSGNREKRFESHTATCSACGNTCDVPFKPTNGKPIFCRDCFKKDGNTKAMPASRGPAPEGQVDLREINRKLDLIIEALDIQEEE